MRAIWSPTIALVLALAVQGCTTLTGKTAGQAIDDATITATVKAKLAQERAATLTRINVDTVRQTVYLNGVVESEAMRERAEQIARQVSGVAAVVNNLQLQGAAVPPPPRASSPAPSVATPTGSAPGAAATGTVTPVPSAATPPLTDAEITTAVKAKLAAEEPSVLVTVAVETQDGTVHLRGTVADEATRDRTVELTRRIPGVREVVNELRVAGS
ncbi:MAG TPA: BON domain-containing protein [Methylomirabilota bacterium]|jgi:hyperosmotically inducible protein|nr:BON domain-containing protein [Methylomirabilota bacterium]